MLAGEDMRRSRSGAADAARPSISLLAWSAAAVAIGAGIAYQGLRKSSAPHTPSGSADDLPAMGVLADSGLR
jgi:hypothetical protein